MGSIAGTARALASTAESASRPKGRHKKSINYLDLPLGTRISPNLIAQLENFRLSDYKWDNNGYQPQKDNCKNEKVISGAVIT